MAIDERFLEELNARCDIVDIVSRYVTLKKQGNNYFGLCPFHNEKSASFSVAPDKQIFYCFGCGAGGGPVSFIMRAEGLQFPDAVRYLAKEYHMTVPETGTNPRQRQQRERTLAALRDAARFYYAQLHTPAGQDALRYFAARALSQKTMNEFGLGYAPDSFTATMDALLKQGYTKDELFTAGLIVRSERGTYYDKFRNRVMFPIIDTRGDVIAFGGRVMDESKPKYLNSPETPVFHKSRNLFAMNRAKKTKKDYFLLAEGYMDVIALHQAGFDSAVASLGTSLTEEQARMLSRYTKTVIICYDADNAGQNAAQRAIDILRRAGLNVKILKIPGAKDPDEYIKSKGADAFGKLLERAGNHIEYRLQAIRDKYDLTENEQRVEYLREAAQALAHVENPIERDVYTASTASGIGIKKEALEQEIRTAVRREQRKEHRQRQREVRTPVKSVQPKARGLHYDNPKSAKAEMGVLSLVFSDASLLDEISDTLHADDFSAPLLGKIYAYACELYRDGRSISVSAYAQMLAPEEMDELVRAVGHTIPTADRRRAMQDYIDMIQGQKLSHTAPDAGGVDPLLRRAEQLKRKNGALGNG